MIDYEGVRAYLKRLGFAETGINTYITSYLHEKKIDILNNFDTYKDLTDEEKLLKFSEDSNISKLEFDQYHQYSKEYTFTDMKSGAKRYKLYKQYQGIMDTVKRFDENPFKFETHGAVWYFKILDIDNKYPVKAICRENIELLELEEDFNTNQAKEKLKKIFNFKGNDRNIKFINIGNEEENMNIWKRREELFKEWAYKTVKRDTSIDSYITSSLNKAIPKKLKELKEKNEDFESVFQLENVNELKELYKRLSNGDLETFNQNTYNRQPSAAVKKYIEWIESNDNGENKKDIDDIKIALNQILYGPPGTGKTYCTIDMALQIIDGKVPESRKEAKERFEELKNAGKIEFVTFHQSYGYEEFVEGIKAIPVGKEGNEDGEEMIYDVSKGIFKKLSEKAQVSQLLKDNSKTFSKKFKLNAPNLNIQAEMIQDDENSFRVLKGSKIRKSESKTFPNKKLKKEVLSKAKYREEDEFYILEEDYTFQSKSSSSSVVLGRSSNGNSDWKEIFDQLSRSAVEGRSKDSNRKNYILIIDEINRGNISKIFGELITLIEESKRLGNEEAMEVTLPYSGEKFGVPNNLYIIGTMNTADRSIALMDTALRRRFEFMEMMPETSQLDGVEIEGINIRKLLEQMNRRIEYLYDRDHTIGHAYFMPLKKDSSLKALGNIFRNKVIPLLQEYFYDDWEKIRLVLGDNQKEEQYQFIRLRQGYDPRELFGSSEAIEIDDETVVYEINDQAFNEMESYIKIYEK